MGLLIDGQWHDRWYDTKSTGGRFQRQESAFRDTVGDGGRFPVAAGRHHLYVSLACPWAHRALIARALLGLENAIGVTVVDPLMAENGWELSGESGPVPGARFLHQVYTRAKPDYTGRVTVPVLWDTVAETIVNNESADILRLLDGPFRALATREAPDLRPAELAGEIDRINALVYADVNNGVYKAGFATTQAAYAEAFDALFAALDELEDLLGRRRYLAGDRFTEADVRLFTTLVRFDAVYHGHFKCNARRIVDYPNLWGWLREVFQLEGIGETVDLDHIKRHYYQSHRTINPTGIVPKGPALDFRTPHGRERLARRAA